MEGARLSAMVQKNDMVAPQTFHFSIIAHLPVVELMKSTASQLLPCIKR